MNRRTVLFGVVAIGAAAGCTRLGIWQLDRLAQRRRQNALVTARGVEPAVPVETLRGRDTADVHWRHVRVRGIPDYATEVVLGTRSQGGSPGVQLVTAVKPLNQAWGDTAVLVIRGWMPAADGRHFDANNTREGDTLDIEGLVTAFQPPGRGAVRMPSAPHAFRWLDRDTLARDMNVPLAPFVLLALGDTVQHDVSRPVRVPPPSLTEGPHWSYALQWFGFAAVAIGGFLAFAMKARRDDAAVE